MSYNVSSLADDTSFQERAAALGAQISRDQVRPLEEMLENLRLFTAVRRREVRIARLAQAERESAAEWRANSERLPEAMAGFSSALRQLSEHARSLQPLIAPALDKVIVLTADEEHPLRRMIHETALSAGFSSEEADWLFGELKAADYQPVRLVCANGFEDLMTLLSCISVGESGLLVAGFARFTGDSDLDARLEKLVIRLREKGVTASLFLALAIVLSAHAVAAQKLAPKAV